MSKLNADGMIANTHVPALEALYDPLVTYDDLPQEAKTLIDGSVETAMKGLQALGQTVTAEDRKRCREVALRLFRQEIITAYVDIEAIDE